MIDDLGDMHSLDVNDNKRLALLNYLESEETKILAFSDIISIYTPPGSNKPWVEHGYFQEEEDQQNTPEGEIFLKTVHLEDQEFVNGYGVFHTPAECIVWCYEGKKEYEAVTESLALSNEERKDHFFGKLLGTQPLVEVLKRQKYDVVNAHSGKVIRHCYIDLGML